jgi:hypothetical protein
MNRLRSTVKDAVDTAKRDAAPNAARLKGLLGDKIKEEYGMRVEIADQEKE